MYLEIKGLTKSCAGKTIIEDIDIATDKGELLCLLGHRVRVRVPYKG